MFEGLFQPLHMVIILGAALLFFGPKKLPELGKVLGEALRGFKKGINENHEQEPAPKTLETKDEPQNKN